MPLLVEGKPLRTVLRWQLYASAASMLIAAVWFGPHGAMSALLGGFINIAAGMAFGWVAAYSRKSTAAEAMLALVRAEAVKVVLIVVQLWVVLVNYKQLVPGPFFGTFVLTVIFFSMAFFVRDR